MDESDSRHLDAASLQWQVEQARAKRWTVMLRMLPLAILAVMLAVVFRVFE